GGAHIHAYRAYWSFSAGMSRELIGTERARLKRHEPRSSAGEGDISSGLTLEHLAHKNQFAAFAAETHAIADHTLAEHRCQFRSEVAHLISVGEKDNVRPGGVNDLFQRDAI